MLTRLVAVLLAFVPGGLLGYVVPPGRYRWAVWASAPILTLGLTSLAVGWLPLLGLPNGTTAVLVTEIGLAGAVVLVARLLATRHSAPQGGNAASAAARRRWGLPRVVDLVGLAVPAVICLAFGRLMLGRYRFPTGWDAMNHATLTGNIIQTGSTAVDAACSTGSTLRAVACRFYPIAVDVSWAQAANLTGGRVSVAMTTWSMVIGPLALVAALYAVVRVMSGGTVVAACAAAVPAVLGPLWAQQQNGRVTGAIPAFGVMIALLVTLAVRERHPARLGLLAGLATAGLLMTHTYDILFAATFTVALLLTFRGRIRIRATAIALGLAAAATLVTLAPLVGDLLHAGGERTARNPVFLGDWTASFHYWVVDLRRYMLFGSPAPGTSIQLPNSLGIHLALWLTVPCLLASPLVFFLPRLHWGRPWLITWATWTAIGIWTSASSSHLADSLAHLWYGNVARLRDMVFVVYTMPAVAGACVIGTLVQLAWTKLPEDRSPRWVAGPVLPTAAALLLVVPLLGLGSLPGPRRDLNNRLTRLTPTSAAYPRVFAWLADHTPKDQVIAYNRNVEFIPWAFGDYGVGALFGIFALVPSSRQNEADRWLAWSWLVDQRGIATQGCLVDKFRIRYVVVGRKRVPGRYPAAYLHPDIAQSPYVDLVHEDQGVQVYQVNDAGRACATAG